MNNSLIQTKTTSLDNVLRRLMLRQEKLQNRLQAACDQAQIPASLLDLIARRLNQYDTQQVATKQSELEKILNIEVVSWEELTRPSLSDLSSTLSQRPRLLRA